jgi:hypothetical protein
MRYCLATLGVLISVVAFLFVLLIVMLRGLTGADEVAGLASPTLQPRVGVVEQVNRSAIGASIWAPPAYEEFR